MWDQGILGWTLSLAVFSSAPDLSETSIPLRIAADGFPIVPIFLNGYGPYDFLLDTGASCTLVDVPLSRKLGLAPLGETRLSTVNGTLPAERVRLDSLTVGPVRVRHLLALTADLHEIRSRDSRVAGVLGYDVLSKNDFLLDFGLRTVSWGMSEAVRGVPVSYQDAGRRVLIITGSLRLVLDTAATNLVLFQPEASSAGPAVRRDLRSLTRISAVGGSRLVRAGVLVELQVGERSFRDLPAALVPRSGVPRSLEEDGLLPARLFTRIYVDPRRRQVIFEPVYAPERRR
jgi:predicted aspartyl protease